MPEIGGTNIYEISYIDDVILLFTKTKIRGSFTCEYLHRYDMQTTKHNKMRDILVYV